MEDPKTAADQTAGTGVAVTISEAFISQRLPFDVPFFLTGTVADTTTTRLTVTVYNISRRAVVSEVISDLQESSNCNPPALASARVSQSAARLGDSRTFSLLIDALEPQRYYVFCFLSSAPVPREDIEGPVRDAIVATMAVFENATQGDIDEKIGQSFHDALGQRIADIGALRPDRATIPEGNIFHKDTRVTPGSPFALLLTRLIDPYRRMALQQKNFTSAREQIVKELPALGTGPAKEFLPADLLGALPSAPPELPPRESAIRIAKPFDPLPFQIDAALVERLVAAARSVPATNAPAADALRRVAEALARARAAAGLYATFYESLRLAAQDTVNQAALEASAINVAFGSSVLGADLARNAYVSLDAGIAYPWRLENMVFYAGTNIYFRPINKAAPLRYKGSFLRRFAVTVGVTTTVKDESRRALDLRPTDDNEDTSNSLLLGGGLRVTPSLRLGAGVLVFKESDPNPLIEQTSVTVTPYVSFAYDVNVAEVLKSFFP